MDQQNLPLQHIVINENTWLDIREEVSQKVKKAEALIALIDHEIDWPWEIFDYYSMVLNQLSEAVDSWDILKFEEYMDTEWLPKNTKSYNLRHFHYYLSKKRMSDLNNEVSSSGSPHNKVKNSITKIIKRLTFLNLINFMKDWTVDRKEQISVNFAKFLSIFDTKNTGMGWDFKFKDYEVIYAYNTIIEWETSKPSLVYKKIAQLFLSWSKDFSWQKISTNQVPLLLSWSSHALSPAKSAWDWTELLSSQDALKKFRIKKNMLWSKEWEELHGFVSHIELLILMYIYSMKDDIITLLEGYLDDPSLFIRTWFFKKPSHNSETKLLS